MCNSVKTGIKRIVAMIVSLLMVLNVMWPATAVTAYAAGSGDYTITVKDENSGEPLSGVVVDYYIYVGETPYGPKRVTTSTDGKFSVVLDEYNVISGGAIKPEYQGAIKVKYTAAKEGYYDVTSELDVTDLSDSGEIRMTQITEVNLGSNIPDDSTEGSVEFYDANNALVNKLAYNQPVTIVVEANTGYRIGSVEVDGESVDVTNTSRVEHKIANVKKDTVVTVKFVETVTVTVSKTGSGTIEVNFDAEENAEAGTVTGVIDKDGSFKVTATAAEHYHVAAVKKDNENPEIFDDNTKDSYEGTFTATGDCTVEVTFAQDVYTITIGEVDAAKGAIIVNGNKNTNVTVYGGEEVTVKAEPAANYRVSTLTIGSEGYTSEANGNVFEKSFTAGVAPYNSAEIAVSAIFAPDRYTVKAEVTPGVGNVYVGDTLINTVDGIMADYGSEVGVNVVPESGYAIERITVNGNNTLDISAVKLGASYEFACNITAAQTIAVEFVKIYTVSGAYDGAEGSVTFTGGSDQDGNSVIAKKDVEVTITVTPNATYRIGTLKIGGVKQTLDDDTEAFTTKVTNADVVVEAEFVKTYTVTVKADESEHKRLDISPSLGVIKDGEVSGSIDANSNLFIIVEPKENYRVTKVEVKNEVKNEEDIVVKTYEYTANNAAHNLGDGVPTIAEVDANYTVDISFAPNRFDLSTTVTSLTEGTADDKVTAKVEGSSTVNYGDTRNIIITPTAGNYVVKAVKVNGTGVDFKPAADGSVKVAVTVTGATVVAVEFVETVTVTVKNNAGGTVRVDFDTEAGTEEGTVIGVIEKYTDFKVIVNADNNYHIETFKKDGASVEGSFGTNDVKSCTKDFIATADSEIEVVFAKDEYTVSVDESEYGDVKIGDDVINNTPMTFDFDENVTVKVVPADGYAIKEVKVNGSVQSLGNTKDGEVFEFTFEGFAENKAIEVTYIRLFTITVVNETGAKGTLAIKGQRGNNVTVREGEKVTITATPATNYRVSKLTIGSRDYTSVDNNKAYSIELTAGTAPFNCEAGSVTEVNALFEKNWFNVSAAVTDNVGGNVYLDAVADDNKLNVEDGKMVDYDAKPTIIVQPDDMYTIKSVKVNNAEKDITNIAQGAAFKIPYTADLTEAQVIEVEFIKLYKVSSNVYESEEGTVTLTGGVAQTDGSVIVKEGESVAVKVTPKGTYRIGSVAINDEVQALATTASFKKTIEDIKETKTVKVGFVKTYTVTVETDDNGKVEILLPDKDAGEYSNNEVTVVVDKNDTLKVVAKPVTNYRVTEVIVDDKSVQTYTKNDADHTEIIENINANHTIQVLFALNQFTVNVETDGKGGKVYIGNENNTSETLDYYESCNVTVEPDEGYAIKSVTVKNKTGDPIVYNDFGNDVRTYEYKVESITEDTTVDVVFIKLYTLIVGYAEGHEGNGTVAITGQEGNSITVKEGESVTVTATPKADWKVLNVYKNGAPLADFVSANDKVYEAELTASTGLFADADTKFIFEFAKNQFEVKTVVTPENMGTAVIEEAGATTETVDYGDLRTILITPASGYNAIEYVKVFVNGIEKEGVAVTANADGSATLNVTVTDTTTVEVKFKEASKATTNDFTWNFGDAIRTEDSLYVFKNNATVTFATTKEKLAIYDKNYVLLHEVGENGVTSVTFDASTEIGKIEVYYQADGEQNKAWHVLKDEYKLVIDIVGAGNFELRPEDANEFGYYKEDVKVAVSAEDLNDDYSGIDKVEYWVVVNPDEEYKPEDTTETNVIYTHADDIKNVFTGEITISATEFNSDNVNVYLRVTDRAGNVSVIENPLVLNINSTVSTVTVSIDGEQNPEALEGFYNGKRTATVVVEDRGTTFNKDAFELSVTAKKLDGTDLEEYKMPKLGEWVEIADNTYRTTVVFESEANYTWGLSYTNKAGWTVNETEFASNPGNKDVYAFTIDKTAPETVLISFEENGWKTLLTTLTFGLWRNTKVTVTAEAADTISDIQSIVYYKYEVPVDEGEVPVDEPLTKEALNALYKDGAFSTAEDAYILDTDGKYVVYARIMDNAGNVVYISTDGIVYDTTQGTIELSAEYNKDGYNVVKNGKVIVKVVVNDLVNALGEDVATSSGIDLISYEILSDKVLKEEGSINLDKVDASDEHPTYYELIKMKTATIEVDAALNNSDDVVVVVTAVDNAGNVYEEQIELTINVTKPTATIELDEKAANKIVDNLGYYKERTATITVTDRATSFNPNGVSIEITADGTAVDRTSGDVVISGWTSDGDKHTATVKFAKDAKYTWSFNYVNKADLALDIENGITTEGETPYYFVKDHTEPIGKISLSGAKWNEEKGKYDESWSDTWSSDTWLDIIKTLTFDLFSSDTIKVTATHVDDNPVIYEYYKTDSTTLLKAEELDELYENGELFKPYTDFDIPNDEQVVIYLRVTDYSGNYNYCSTNGSIIDKSDGRITFSSTSGIYNKDVPITINVTDVIQDVKSYSGINKIEYWVESDGKKTQGNVLYPSGSKKLKQTELMSSWSDNITVLAANNNSSDVKVYVKVTDNAGNEWIADTMVDIDITNPSLDVDFSGSGTYYNVPCRATLTIVERSEHFDESDVSIFVDAKDAAGKDINTNAYSLSGWSTSGSGDGAIHTATIDFDADANYTFSISFADMAGNSAGGETFAFSVDTNKPTGNIKIVTQEGAELSTSELQTDLTFDAYSREKITISATYSDLTTMIENVQYYIDEVDGLEAEFNALTAAELDKVSGWAPFSGLTIDTDKKFVVYLKLTDSAGNYTYLSTRGLVVDKNAPVEELVTPQITLEPEKTSGDVYSDDVTIGVKVTDPIIEGAYAGLKTISYKVFDKAVSITNPTQEGVLYTFGINNPKQSDMLQLWESEIVVDSQLNNSNEVIIEVYAEDNARNSSKNEVTVKIDKTAPTIDIAYNNNSADNDKYFKDNRTATITVTERNFNPDDVIVMITNTDGVIPSVGSWAKHEGTGNLDNTRWTADLTYDHDGDYTFDIAYADVANNVCTDISYGNSVAPVEFTIDKTLPSVAVSYDNNTAMNNTYFNAGRTATVVIAEHNFDVSRVEFLQTASLNGANITVPTASWTHEGDVHTAVIKYVSDGDYTFDVSVTDMAANKNNAIDYGNSKAPAAFTVDQTVNTVTISGIENGKAYKEDVIPEINFMDVNYDSYEVQLLHTSMGKKDVDVTSTFITTVTEEAQGGSGTYNTFEKVEENDGIYTLILTLTDKAGNSKTEKVVFTVNRFGSVYEYDNYLIDLISYGGKYVTELTSDLVITEYNADKLVSDSLNIEVTCDGKPINEVLYDVTPAINALAEVGDSEWFQYQYTISKENFVNDGIYKIAVSSKDETGNTPENNNYGSILFRVDTTAPEITSIVGFEESIVNAQELVAKYTVYDTIGLKSVKIFVDGNQLGEEITDFDVDINNYSGRFTLGESTEPQTVRIVVEDLAGNITDTASESFASAYVFNDSVTVSTNMLVRFYANKPLFWGSIGGTAAAATAAGVGLAIRRRKKLK